jgi:hypothetical protein
MINTFCHPELVSGSHRYYGRKSQGLVELVLIVPLLIVMLLGILEYSLFQRNVSTVQDIAMESAVAASKYFVDEDSSFLSTTPYSPTENPAVDAALKVVRTRVAALGVPNNLSLNFHDMGSAFGTRPFALYEFDSTQNVDYNGSMIPLVTFTVDYRDPKGKGVSTQLIYHYNLILFGVSLYLPGGRKVVIIPRNVKISSTQTRQYVYY